MITVERSSSSVGRKIKVGTINKDLRSQLLDQRPLPKGSPDQPAGPRFVRQQPVRKGIGEILFCDIEV